MHRHPALHLQPEPDAETFACATAAYACSGGLLAADAVAQSLDRQHGQGISRVARWIVDSSVLSIAGVGGIWLPAFQLHPVFWTPRTELAPVLATLPPPTDSWRWTDWFAEANELLQGRRPADLLACAPGEVLQAARQLRFVCLG
ncbi:hypothetical protein [Pseudorhodoferax sp.]|uniref:hypothetical protein n=1 Tax=Pseudorhodoferax sp. TaxID=1993553 RepID=UPI002DD655B1|nr:hypothetical protein [Pseudorhodoferax sp.]